MSPVVAFPLDRSSSSARRRRVASLSVCKASYAETPQDSPSSDEVKEQLSKILQSQSFRNAERMKHFLQFLVAETLAGRSSQLCEYSVGRSVFGRGESFQPGIDPIVRNDARRLRQKLLEYYQGSRGDRVVIEVPKGGYVPVFHSASCSKRNPSESPYRLVVSLTRSVDGAETWTGKYELNDGDTFELHLETASRRERK